MKTIYLIIYRGSLVAAYEDYKEATTERDKLNGDNPTLPHTIKTVGLIPAKKADPELHQMD